jgi:putative membrane protein
VKFTSATYDLITNAVAQAEEKTSAEIVVVVYPCSGNYRDVDFLFGATVAWLTILFILFSDYLFYPLLIPIDLIIIFTLFVWICSATSLRKFLTTNKRRDQQVKTTAAALFTQEGVANTRARTGILIFLSVLERRIEVMCDLLIADMVPQQEWEKYLNRIREIEKSKTVPEDLIKSINELGDLLSIYLPPGEDNPDEIPNRPRVLND